MKKPFHSTPIDLPDVELTNDNFSGLVVRHKKTGMVAVIPPSQLNAWLLRQLRNELISPKEKL